MNWSLPLNRGRSHITWSAAVDLAETVIAHDGLLVHRAVPPAVIQLRLLSCDGESISPEDVMALIAAYRRVFDTLAGYAPGTVDLRRRAGDSCSKVNFRSLFTRGRALRPARLRPHLPPHRGENMDIRSAQKLAWENKIGMGFNATDVPWEFGLLPAETFTARRKGLPDFGDELADASLYLVALAEITGIDLCDEVTHKIEKNTRRVYERNEEVCRSGSMTTEPCSASSRPARARPTPSASRRRPQEVIAQKDLPHPRLVKCQRDRYRIDTPRP